jgi:hypothetical protein
VYRSLNSEKIIQTIGQLRDRITERFPNSGLSKVAEELLSVSKEAVARATWIGRPHLPLRISVAVLILLIVLVLGSMVRTLSLNTGFSNFSDFIQAMEASFNLIILVGAGIVFLVTVEIRMKRKKALRMLHELRALAHLVDIHQLTKDPERLTSSTVQDTPSSPTRNMNRFQLSRYLDYCSEMLSLIGKIAAIYAQYFDDPVVLEAVDEVEDLTTGLSRKIWQKIMLIHQNPEPLSV